MWKEGSGDQTDYLNIKLCAPAGVLHPSLWMGHKALSWRFINDAACSQEQSWCELCFHGSAHGRGAQAEQQMQVIIAQSFCFKGLGHLNVTVYKWELLEEIEQSDFKGV